MERPPHWCETCQSWRHTLFCGRDDCPNPPVDWSEVTRQKRRRLARQAGILADVVVNRKAITQSQKDEVVALLRACEKELIDAS